MTERDTPRSKAWETVGEPTLWVIGRYRMGFRIAADGASSLLIVLIDYDLPRHSSPRAAGWLLGGIYARWCTGRMAADAARHFQFRAHGPQRAVEAERSMT